MRLKEFRQARKLTQAEIGIVIGKSAPTIHRLETGLEPIRLPDLRKLAAFFEISVAELIDEDIVAEEP